MVLGQVNGVDKRASQGKTVSISFLAAIASVVLLFWGYDADRPPTAILARFDSKFKMGVQHTTASNTSSTNPITGVPNHQTLDEESDSEEPPPIDNSTRHLCLDTYPWIQPTVDAWFAPALRSYNESTQTSQEALDKILQDIKWGDYTPGHDVITLAFDATTDSYSVLSKVGSPPNREHKQRCILPSLRAAVEAHNNELKRAFNEQNISFAIATEDFPIIQKDMGWKLPAFALCAEENSIDIPVPDFTFGCYPETRYEDSSWEGIKQKIFDYTKDSAWTERHADIFSRGYWGVGPRQVLMPWLNGLHAHKEDVVKLGVEVNVGDSGWEASDDQAFVPLHEQCNHKYLLHTAGFSYSAGLKYKLACGSVVFYTDSTYSEWYYPALEDGVHVIRLPGKKLENHPNADLSEFEHIAVPIIKAVIEATNNSTEEVALASGARQFAEENLSVEAVSCYWMAVLMKYGSLYLA